MNKKGFYTDTVVDGFSIILDDGDIYSVLNNCDNAYEVVSKDLPFKPVFIFKNSEKNTDVRIFNIVMETFEKCLGLTGVYKKLSSCCISFISTEYMILRFPNIKLTMKEVKYLNKHIHSLTNLTLLDFELEKFAIPIPYVKYNCSDTKMYNGYIHSKYKHMTVGKKLAGNICSTNHFNHSEHSILHFSFDENTRRKVHTMILLDDHVNFHFNEVVYGNFIFFVDCDKKISLEEEEISPFLVGTVMRNAYQKATEKEYCACDIFSASGKSKMSVHVRFYNDMVDIYTARKVAQRMKDSHSPQNNILETIDLQPYSSGSVQLRLPFCDKPNANRKLIYYGTLTETGHFQKHWNQDVLERSSLINCVPGERKNVPYHLIRDNAYFTFSKKMRYKDDVVVVEEDDSDDVVISDVLQYYLNRFTTETVGKCTLNRCRTNNNEMHLKFQ
ncbi:MAG: hypothetical protein CMB64_03990 [Euryarchaeota archaeon]|nr:hypothetical protein [Euryarchaeota archaeon]